jgi:ribosome-binding protein aMBF1 (putative translation factor)
MEGGGFRFMAARIHRRRADIKQIVTIVTSLGIPRTRYSNGVDTVTRDTDAFVEALAAVLRTTREEQRMSKTELAARAGLSQPHIGFVERGIRVPTVDSLKRISIALGLSATDLVGKAEALAASKSK